MGIYIYPYHMGSKSAKDLARSLGVRRVFPDGKYKPKPHHLVINWGSAKVPNWYHNGVNLINSFDSVNRASNKLLTARSFKEAGVSTPEWTTDHSVAVGWLREGRFVVARKYLRDMAAKGLVLLKDPDITKEVLEDSGYVLYSLYKKKKDEYRIHILNETVFSFSQKKLRNGFERNEETWQIRNYRRGWIYARTDVIPNKKVLAESIKAVEALGLDFGAVDVGWNDHEGNAYIYEVNTAPGLEASTLEDYVRAFSKLHYGEDIVL